VDGDNRHTVLHSVRNVEQGERTRDGRPERRLSEIHTRADATAEAEARAPGVSLHCAAWRRNETLRVELEGIRVDFGVVEDAPAQYSKLGAGPRARKEGAYQRLARIILSFGMK